MDRNSAHMRFSAASYVAMTLFAMGLIAVTGVIAAPAVMHLAHSFQTIQQAVSQR